MLRILLKVGSVNEGRAKARDVIKNGNIPLRKELILRFLVISSYLLDRNYTEGEREVGAFLYNYRRLEGMSLNIKDNELDFEGFEALITTESDRQEGKINHGNAYRYLAG